MSSKLKPLTLEEIAWTNKQPVVGKPSVTRLRAALEAIGLLPVKLVLHPDGENVEFWLERGPAVGSWTGSRPCGS